MLKRSRTGCSPTAAGKVLYDGLRNLAPQFEALLAETRKAGEERGASVLVAGTNLINDPLYYNALADFTHLHGGIRVGMQYARRAESGAFDVISSGVDYDEGSYVECNHVMTRCFLVMSKYNALVGRVGPDGEIDLAELGGATVVVGEESLPAGTWPECVNRLYGDAGVHRVASGLLGPSGVDQLLVAEGAVQLCLAPRYVHTPQLVQIPIRDSALRYQILVQPGAMRPEVREYVDYIAKRYNDEWDAVTRQIAAATALER